MRFNFEDKEKRVNIAKNRVSILNRMINAFDGTKTFDIDEIKFCKKNIPICLKDLKNIMSYLLEYKVWAAKKGKIE